MLIDNHLFFIKRYNISLRGAYRLFGVKKKSYMGSVVRRIYDYYCGDASNLYFTYLRYYKSEFSSYEVYLEKHFNLFPEEVEQLKSRMLYHKDLSFQPENNITNLMEDTAISNTLKRFLGDKGDCDEG
jgi:hypothetical protein